MVGLNDSLRIAQFQPEQFCDPMILSDFIFLEDVIVNIS